MKLYWQLRYCNLSIFTGDWTEQDVGNRRFQSQKKQNDMTELIDLTD